MHVFKASSCQGLARPHPCRRGPRPAISGSTRSRVPELIDALADKAEAQAVVVRREADTTNLPADGLLADGRSMFSQPCGERFATPRGAGPHRRHRPRRDRRRHGRGGRLCGAHAARSAASAAACSIASAPSRPTWTTTPWGPLP
jgi:hypothetical protein